MEHSTCTVNQKRKHGRDSPFGSEPALTLPLRFSVQLQSRNLCFPLISLPEPSRTALPRSQAWELRLAVPVELHWDGTLPLRVLLLQIPPQNSFKSLPKAPSPGCFSSRLSPCVSVYLLCVPAEPRRPHTSCLHISCKFEFDLVGWSPGGLLDAFEKSCWV